MDIELNSQTLMLVGGIVAAGGIALFLPTVASSLITYLDEPAKPAGPTVVDRGDTDPAESILDVTAPRGFAEHVDIILLASPDATSEARIKYLQAALSRDQVLCLECKA